MPLKSKPKSQRQMEELIELLEWKLSELKGCQCRECQMGVAMYECSGATLSWALGNAPKNFNKLVSALKYAHGNRTKHQHAHAE